MQTTTTTRGVAADDTQSVIVQMESTDSATADVAELATHALSQRSLALSARDCLPPDRSPEETTTEATPRPLLLGRAFELRGSLLARAADAPDAPSDEEFDRDARSRLEPLL